MCDMEHKTELTAGDHAVFNDIAATGVSESLRLLSKMTGRHWNVFPSKLALSDLPDVLKKFSPRETVRFGGDLALKGDMAMSLLYVFPQESMINITHCFTNESLLDSNPMSLLEEWAVAEVSNVLANAFLNTVANTLKMKILPTVPRVIAQTRQVLLEKAAERAKIKAEHVLFCEMRLEVQNLAMSAAFYLLLDSASLKALINKMHRPQKPSADNDFV